MLEEPDALKRDVRIAALLVCQHDDEAAHRPRPGTMSAADVAGLPDQ